MQWMGGLVRISTGKAIQWRGPGDSVNRRTLKTEKLLSSSPTQKSGPEKGGHYERGLFTGEISKFSGSSRISRKNGRKLLSFPQSGGSLETLESPNSLESLENGFFWKDPFSKRPLFPNRKKSAPKDFLPNCTWNLEKKGKIHWRKSPKSNGDGTLKLHISVLCRGQTRP